MKNGERIMALTGMTAAEYSQAIWDGALEYCHTYSYGHTLSIDSLMLTRGFWRWWRGVWEEMDNQFLHQYSRYAGLDETEYLRVQYTLLHQVENVSLSLSEEIVRESFQIMKQKAKKP